MANAWDINLGNLNQVFCKMFDSVLSHQQGHVLYTTAEIIQYTATVTCFSVYNYHI